MFGRPPHATAGATAPEDTGERELAPNPQHGPAVARLTERQAIVLSAFTGHLLCPFYRLQEAVDLTLDRVTYTHQYGAPELWAEIKAAFYDEAIAMLPDGFAR